MLQTWVTSPQQPFPLPPSHPGRSNRAPNGCGWATRIHLNLANCILCVCGCVYIYMHVYLIKFCFNILYAVSSKNLLFPHIHLFNLSLLMDVDLTDSFTLWHRILLWISGDLFTIPTWEDLLCSHLEPTHLCTVSWAQRGASPGAGWSGGRGHRRLPHHQASSWLYGPRFPHPGSSQAPVTTAPDSVYQTSAQGIALLCFPFAQELP